MLQQGKPRGASIYSAEGTAAHHVLTLCLQQNVDAAHFKGDKVGVDDMGRVVLDDRRPEWTFDVDDDMVEAVQCCIDYVKAAAGDDGTIVADRRVNYSRYLDVPEADAWGTADVIILRGDEIIVVDYKHGMGVEVSAGERDRPNPQMALYALGALAEFGDIADFSRVRLVISQPRIKRAASEFDLSVEELEAWGYGAARSSVATCLNATDGPQDERWQEVFLRPGEKQCKFCSAKATCPALRDEVADTLGISAAAPDEFAGESVSPADANSVAEWLAACLSKVDLIEDWCKAVRAEADRRLQAGEPVPGFKLAQGKRGPRQWSSADAAETLLKSMRLKMEEMYNFKVISPTDAEKLHKAGTIGPRQWPKVQEIITQSDGKLHVAPDSDPRQAVVVTATASDFDDMTASDLA